MNATMEQVRALLAQGHELRQYRETRSTLAGWVINGDPVHGATVNALFKRAEIELITPPRSGRGGYDPAIRRIGRRRP